MGISEKIGLYAIGVLFGSLVYAMDWQREQDKKVAGLDTLISKQMILLEMQTKITEMQFKMINDNLVVPSTPPVDNK